MVFAGVDPGYQGGIVILDEDKKIVDLLPMPVRVHNKTKFVSPTPIAAFLGKFATDWKLDNLFIERVWTNTQLIWGVGVIRSIALELDINVIEVEPSAWQHYAYGRTNKGNKDLAELWVLHRYGNAPELCINEKLHNDYCEATIIACCGIDAFNKNRIKRNKITAKGLGY